MSGGEPKPVPEWTPPFSSDDSDLICPKCGEEDVQIRAKDWYGEGDTEAYCGACHADLIVQARVEITFSDPEVADG